jgi:hypothetical protein
MFKEQVAGPYNYLVHVDSSLNQTSLFYKAVENKDEQPPICALLNAACTVFSEEIECITALL